MTKTDKVQASIKKGVAQINVVESEIFFISTVAFICPLSSRIKPHNSFTEIYCCSAFNAALKMLSDNPSRVDARQVIYYLTDTDP